MTINGTIGSGAITATGLGSFGEGLTVNANITNQNHLTLEGMGTGASERGGSIKWNYSNVPLTIGYTYLNSSAQFVWDGVAQPSPNANGKAWVDFTNGSASFGAGNLIISSAGDVLCGTITAENIILNDKLIIGESSIYFDGTDLLINLNDPSQAGIIKLTDSVKIDGDLTVSEFIGVDDDNDLLQLAPGVLTVGGLLKLNQNVDGPNFGTGVPTTGIRSIGFDDRNDKYLNFSVDENGFGVIGGTTSTFYFSPSNTRTAFFTTSEFGLSNDKSMRFGDSANQMAAMQWNTTQTVDTLMLGLDDNATFDGKHIIVCDEGDFSFDFAHTAQLNPTIFIHSAEQSTTEWLSLTHNGTDGVLDVGKGILDLRTGLSVNGNINLNDILYIGENQEASIYSDGTDLNIDLNNPSVLGVLKINTDIVLPKASGNGIKVDLTTPTFGFADMLGYVRIRTTGANRPSRVQYNGEISGVQFTNGDKEEMEFHFRHDYAMGTDIHLHIHWSQNATGATGGTVTFKYSAIYAKGHNQASGSTFTSTPITASFTSIDIDDGGAGLTQYQQHLTEVIISGASATAALFDRDDFEPDGLILMTLEMETDSLTGTASSPFIMFVDIHYQTSGLIGTKQKAPDFYGDLI